MVDPFVGRRAELRFLEEAYRSPGSAFTPVYGRRRVGKSELILHFLRSRNGVYFLGKQAPAGLQMREFLQEAAASLEQPLLGNLAVDSWSAVLSAVIDSARGRGKLILALDEFQWMAEASPELPSVLQALWDRKWKPAGDVFLILCGSSIGFMERAVLGRDSPLFGRRTGQIRLQPFSYLEAAEFHPSYSLEDRARAFFICGGIPQYLQQFTARRSLETNIREALLSDWGALRWEPDFLLREELRDVGNYHAILVAIASGETTNQAISAATGIGERSLHYYLQQLVDLGYLGRRFPLTGEKSVARRVRYELEDALLRFWFRFVFPNTTHLAQAGPDATLADRIRPLLDSYYGGCFERLCRESLPRLYRSEGVRAGFEVGQYWGPQTQIDVVGLREDNWTDLGECKWGSVRSARTLVEELHGKAQHFPNKRGATIGLRIFSRRRVSGASLASAAHGTAGGVRFHSLEELYEGTGLPGA